MWRRSEIQLKVSVVIGGIISSNSHCLVSETFKEWCSSSRLHFFAWLWVSQRRIHEEQGRQYNQNRYRSEQVKGTRVDDYLEWKKSMEEQMKKNNQEEEDEEKSQY